MQKKNKADKIVVISVIVTVAMALAISGAFIINALIGGETKNEVEQEIDYTEEEFEAALRAGEDTIGKTVKFVVKSIHPDSICGYNLWSGVHLNFCSDESIDAVDGQEMVVKVTNTYESVGSFMINYEVIKK